MSDPRHSALYLDDSRRGWWNLDFLELVARRLALAEVHRALDVGCGLGHWTRLVGGLLAGGAEVVGLDREPDWVARASALPHEPERRYRYERGLAEALPFPDHSFDLVTCQTLLIHVKEPRAVLAEMVRVLRPGGVLLVVEPNNLGSGLAKLITDAEIDPEELSAFVKLQATCERGKHRLGLGFNSIGEHLLAHLDGLDLERIDAAVCDHCSVIMPPADSPRSVALRRSLEQMREQDVLIWPRAEALKYFVAGGGAPEDFGPQWRRASELWYRRIDRLAAGELWLSAGSLLYLVSARRGSAGPS